MGIKIVFMVLNLAFAYGNYRLYSKDHKPLNAIAGLINLAAGLLLGADLLV